MRKAARLRRSGEPGIGMVEKLIEALTEYPCKRVLGLGQSAASLSHGFTEMRLAEPICDY
jgi:hypothetical protein